MALTKADRGEIALFLATLSSTDEYSPPETGGKWIYFELIAQKAKTQVWNIVSKQDNMALGYIAWFSRWRKYSFFPNNNMVFETDCLKDIVAFIEKLKYSR